MAKKKQRPTVEEAVPLIRPLDEVVEALESAARGLSRKQYLKLLSGLQDHVQACMLDALQDYAQPPRR